MEERILVLDDEENITELLASYLRGREYACDSTISPFEALEMLKGQKYSLLLTDLKMPKMSGIEVLRHAKEHDPDLAVVVVTALMEVTNAIQAMRMGADDYVLKPFNLSEISLSVSRALEKRRMAIENREYQEQLSSRVEAATENLAQVNQELRRTKQYLENLLDSSVDAILTIDLNGNLNFANSAAVRMFGYEQEELMGLPAVRLFSNGEEEVRYIDTILEQGRFLQNYEASFMCKDKQEVPVSMSISRVKGTEGENVATLAVCKDITEQRRLQRELQEMSIKDSLTSLYNQGHFYERLKTEIERAKRQKHPLSLLLLDVDQFKSYNDSHGHLEGDKVLKTVGQVIRNSTRDHVDIGFRYGGDEFTVILPEADEEQATVIAERIRREFETYRFDHLTVSIGVMSYRESYSLRSFIQFTDAKMYDAKRSGGNRVRVYRPGENEIKVPPAEDEE